MNALLSMGDELDLLPAHIFQFDFLNDNFDKLPEALRKIIEDSEQRKKLIIFINPPMAEHGNRSTMMGTGINKSKVATETKVYNDFESLVGTATRELFVQFLLRIYRDIPDAKLGTFCKLKIITAQNFIKFSEYFRAAYKNGFICLANTFDNVKGNYPLAFLVWDLSDKQKITQITTDVLLCDKQKEQCWKDSQKVFYTFPKNGLLVNWLRQYYDDKTEKIAFLRVNGPDFEANRGVFITSSPSKNDIEQHFIIGITKKNCLVISIYLAVRQSIEATWLNDRDQFLYPNDGWNTDTDFQNDCLVFTLLHGQNRISCDDGINNWIPYTEKQVGAKEKFESHFMSDFIKGRVFSPEAQTVLDAGLALFQYYHKTIFTNNTASVNASFYDIRAFFQGIDEKGRMKSGSRDEGYTTHLEALREAMKGLAAVIQPKVREYGFLR
jgi:hypothetical protein